MSIVPSGTINNDEHRLLKLKKDILSRFKCQKSGNCCKCPGVVYVTQPEISAMATILDQSSIEFRQDYVVKKNGWDVISDTQHRPNCFLASDNACSVYKARPMACQTYPDWPDIWISQETIEKECGICPGLKKAHQDVLGSNF